MKSRFLRVICLLCVAWCLPLSGYPPVCEDETPIIRIDRFQEKTSLVVPKSFEGRTGKEETEGTTFAFADLISFTRTESKSRLQGRTNRFDFDMKSDHLRGLLWESRTHFPRRNMCMDCHGNETSQSRTRVWVGDEFRELTPKPIVVGNAVAQFATADVRKAYFELKHWVTPHQAVTGGASMGKVRSFKTYQKASSAWLGWSWHDRRNIEVSSEFRSSKADLSDSKREFIGRFAFKVKKGFELVLKGGILLDGIGQYDLGFSDMGTVLISTEKYAPEDLPSIYSNLKNDQFGYYSILARYQYAF
jgi:hypothetical protein